MRPRGKHLSNIESSEGIFVGGLGEQPTEVFINALSTADEPPTVRFLTSDRVLKWVRHDFHIASKAADLIESETLSLRNTTANIGNTLLVTDDSAIPLVASNDQTVTPETDSDYVKEVQDHCIRAWENNTAFNLRTPPRSQVYETLAEQIDDNVRNDYQTMLEEVGSTRSDQGKTYNGDNMLNEVGLAVLSIAHQQDLLYDLGQWGDRIGLASRSTFSRMKTQFEECGLIDTEKVPIDVGRPRQRLLLNEQLRKYDAGELPGAVRDELENSSQ